MKSANSFFAFVVVSAATIRGIPIGLRQSCREDSNHSPRRFPGLQKCSASPAALVKGSRNASHLYLHRSIMVFMDLLQSPLQPLPFRLPFPLQPANGLRHSAANHGCANRSSHTLRPALLATACGRARRHRCPALGCRAPSHGKRPWHTRWVSCVPSAVTPDPIPPLVNPDYCFPGLLLL